MGVRVRVKKADVDAGLLSLSMKKSRMGNSFSGGGNDYSAFESVLLDTWTTGKVFRIESFGVFVTVKHPETEAEADGLVHITEIRDGIVKSIEDEVEVGQEVNVRIKSMDLDARRISLSMKHPGSGISGYEHRALADVSAFAELPTTQWLKGTVVRHAPFGLFVTVKHPETGAEADGLVHITQISDGFVENVENFANIGDKVDVWIQSVDTDSGKICLSMKRKRKTADGDVE